MRLHTRVQDPPRLLLVLRNVRDALDFLVPSGVEMGIKDVSILRCSIRHCLSTEKEKARNFFWAEKLRGGGNFEQTCFYKPKTFFYHKSKFCKNKPHFPDRFYNKKGHF